MATVVPIILAGGAGSRLWPLSRELFPKQLLSPTGDDSLLQRAARLALQLSHDGPVVTVTAESAYFTVLDQLREVAPPLCELLLTEPTQRGTAAAVALAALAASEREGDPLLFVAPADQAIARPAELEAAVIEAADAAARGEIVALGLPEARLHWGLDLIRLDASEPGDGLRGVAGWEPQPDPVTVSALCADGRAAWSSGMFVASASRLLEALTEAAPELMAGVRGAWAARTVGKQPLRFPRAAWSALPAVNLGPALLGTWGRARVRVLDPGYSHTGSWMGVWESSPKDGAGNAVQGDVLLEDSRGCLVRSDGRLVACAGVEDLAIVETADAVLVARKGETRSISELVARLKRAGRPEAANHLKDQRPWGSFRVLMEGPRYKIKEILVNPGASLSMQMHYHRSEHWVVIEGTARVSRGDEAVLLSENQSTYIPVGTRHRLENPGRVPLRIVEVQNGAYLGEDDIVRFEDVYGRDG